MAKNTSATKSKSQFCKSTEKLVSLDGSWWLSCVCEKLDESSIAKVKIANFRGNMIDQEERSDGTILN